MSNFKLIAIPENVEEREAASIKITDISGNWLCNILSTGYIVFNSERDHCITDIEEYVFYSKRFFTLFNNIKTQ